MKKNQRLAAGLLAFILLFALLTACSGKKETASFSLIGYDAGGAKLTLIDGAKVELSHDFTALDVISAALSNAGFSFEDETYIYSVTAKDGTVYLAGALGESSGWIFAVNGVIPNVGMGEAVVKANDEVTLRFVSDFNTDVDWTAGTFVD